MNLEHARDLWWWAESVGVGHETNFVHNDVIWETEETLCTGTVRGAASIHTTDPRPLF